MPAGADGAKEWCSGRGETGMTGGASSCSSSSSYNSKE